MFISTKARGTWAIAFIFCGSRLLREVVYPDGSSTYYNYDKQARIIGVIDAEGYVTRYGYDDSGKVTERIVVEKNRDYDYRVIRTESGENRLEVTAKDPLNSTYFHLLDDSYRLIEWEGFLEHQCLFSYNEYGQEEARQDAYGGIWTTVYDSQGLPYQLIDAEGRVTTIERDGYCNPRFVQRPNRAPEEFIWGYSDSSFDQDGRRRRLQVHVDGIGNRTTYSYDSLGQLELLTDALGRETSYEHDDLGNLRFVTDWLDHTTETVPDAAGRASVTVDALRNRFTATFDTGNRLLTTQNPLGHITTNLYDELGNLSVATNYRGHATHYDYNVFDQVKRAAIENDEGRFNATTYDRLGRPIATYDALNKRTTTTYDAMGRPFRTVDPAGRITTVIYDQEQNGYRADAMIDTWGYRTTTAYDHIGRVKATIDPLNIISGNRYDLVDEEGRPVTATVNGETHRTTTIYDPAGQAIATVDYLGHRTTTTYDAVGRVRTVENAVGQVTTTTYDVFDPDGRLAEVTVGPSNEPITTIYDGLGRAIEHVDAARNRTTTIYDRIGRVSASIDALGKITTMLHDAWEGTKPVQVTIDPRGYRATTIYDVAGRVIATVDATLARTTIIYDGAGRAFETIDALERTCTTLYDAVGRVEVSIDPMGHRTTTIYDQRTTLPGHDPLPSITYLDERGNPTVSVMDPAGREFAVIDASLQKTETHYDRAHRPVAMVDPLGRTTTTVYDLFESGRPAIATIDALGRRSTVAYDAIGREVERIDELGNRTTMLYDPSDKGHAVQNANNYRTTFLYDEITQQEVVINANGRRTTMQYDARGLTQSVLPPSNVPTLYEYDEDGTPIYRRDARGQETFYTPDSLGRITTITYSEGGQITHGFDTLGREQSMGDATGLTTYNFDDADRLTGIDSPTGELGYVPDVAGNRHVMLDANGHLTTYSYDEQNRLSRIENAFGEITTITYDPLGREAFRYLSNGVTEERTYDEIGRDHTVLYRGAQGSLLAFYTLTYDSMGTRFRQRMEELDGSVVTFLYDETYQLVQEHRTGTAPYLTNYEYDGVGNRLLEVTTTPDGRITTATYGYDASNHLTGLESETTVTIPNDWQPGSVTNLELWLRADLGVTQDSFGAVSVWADQSGQSHDATQTVGTQRPLVVQNTLNGHAVLRFDGSNDFLSTSYSGPQSDEITLFVLARATSLAGYGGLLCFGATNAANYLTYPHLNAGQAVLALSNDGGTAGGVSTGLLAGQWNIASASWQRDTLGGVQTYRNENLIAQRRSSDSALPQVPLSIGRDTDAGANFSAADVAEVLVYSRALSALEREQVTTYLSQKYAIALD